MSEGDDLVWLRGELPWLDTGFLGRVAPERVGLALADLQGLDFTTYVIDGSRMKSATHCYAEVTRALGFWGNWHGNPDAFVDYMSDVEFPRRAAIVWTSTSTLAAIEPVVFARVVSLLALTKDGMPSDVCQLEIFLSE